MLRNAAMTFTLLVPRAQHPAVEEQYAYAQSRLLVRGEDATRPLEYDSAAPASDAVAGIASGTIVVLTDPMLIVPRSAARDLATFLGESAATAVVPSTNESVVDAQRIAPAEPYLTLLQFEEASPLGESATAASALIWPDADPGLFAIDVSALRNCEKPMARALEGIRVAVCRRVFAHRWASQRGQSRPDLLELIARDASTVLEFGCGEGALGEALKRRQPCRVVGIELDRDAAAIARGRLDLVVEGDARRIVMEIDETFDWIVGGDIVEHLDDPWSFLRNLRRVCQPNARLLLSVPNLGCWPVVRDLLRGRFDYVYMGITCAGHLRFFTRQTIEEMLQISGWRPISITPQAEFRTRGFEQFLEELRKTNLVFAESDLATTGFYVVATPA